LEKQLRRRKYQQLWTYMGRLYHWGVRKGGTILLWGYAEGHNFDFGVREYLKFENPWKKQLSIATINFFFFL
jgi:hypothetical protein